MDDVFEAGELVRWIDIRVDKSRTVSGREYNVSREYPQTMI